jgi:hypothetical protein
MPSFQSTLLAARAPAPALAATASLPPAREGSPSAATLVEHDSTTDQTRVSLTTHRGTYFLWVQRPRLTFFYVYSGIMLQHPPASVFLVFRTHEPQAPATNHLALSCEGVEVPQSVARGFAFEPGLMVTTRAFTYELSLETFAAFVSCDRAALTVGDIAVPFTEGQLLTLRDFAAGMGGPPKR